MASISPSRAWRIVLEHVRPLASIRVPLSEALRACLAGDIRADRDIPPTDRSAMDGFAVQARDIARRGASLKLIGESAAGSPSRPSVSPGTCVQTLTGAVVPRGADAVVKVEETRSGEGRVTFLTSIKRGTNIRRRAEVAAKGDTVLDKGTMLGPSQIGLCASVGKYDFVPGAVKQIGATIRFHGVKMKPGGPQLYATIGRNRHIFGLPGNPLSALNGLHELALPAIRRMSGVAPKACQPALHLPLGRTVRVKGTRWEYVLARLVQGPGRSHLLPLKSTGSGDLLAAAQGDGVFLIPKGASEVPAGQIVEFRPWKTLA